MNNKIERGELTATFTFAAALLFALLATWVSGCGDAIEPGEAIVAPVVRIECDAPVGEPRCHIIAHGADAIEATYGIDRLAWWDAGITESRVVYVDSPPPGVLFTVTACNPVGCTEASITLPRVAQNDDDPLGCDPDLPCPIEALT